MVDIGREEERGKRVRKERGKKVGPGRIAIKACMMDELGVRKSVKVVGDEEGNDDKTSKSRAG